MINDSLSDMITRLRNAYAVGKTSVTLPHTTLLENLARVLVEEKYLSKLEVIKSTPSHLSLVMSLAYAGTKPSISSIKRISKPGIRTYKKSTELRPVLSGMGIAILSTSRGIMTDRSAKKAKLGGEVLVELW